jgi:hypothetical protein
MLYFLLWLCVLGAVAWYVDAYIPMTPMIKGLFRLVVIIIVLVLLFQILSNFAPPSMR